MACLGSYKNRSWGSYGMTEERQSFFTEKYQSMWEHRSLVLQLCYQSFCRMAKNWPQLNWIVPNSNVLPCNIWQGCKHCNWLQYTKLPQILCTCLLVDFIVVQTLIADLNTEKNWIYSLFGALMNHIPPQ